MSLTALQVRDLKDSYALIIRAPDNYSDLFYHRLLHQHPFARTLFPDDMARQIEIFRQTIDALVEQIDSLPELKPVLAALATRHVEYGVRSQHYAVVGKVLIDCFEDVLGHRFTATMRQAWEVLYSIIADVMISEAYSD